MFDNIPRDQRLEAIQKVAMQRGLKTDPAERRRILEQEAAKKGLLTYETFEAFVKTRRPDLLQHEYMQRMVNVAQRVIDGVIKRLMVFVPTQYGKSTIMSQLLPAYYLLKYPNRVVALTSYGADLAWTHSAEARDLYVEAGGQFKDGATKGASRNWRTVRYGGMSGGMWATGVAGGSLGKGYNLGICDDPMNPEQAIRDAYRKRFARWWPAQWLRGQRGGGNAAIILIMQRLDIADAAAWLLEREETNAAEKWHIVVMDEVKSPEPFGRYDGPLGFPKTCTVEPDPRAMGEVLAPKFRDEAEVKHMQATAGPIVAGAQRQQRPMRPTGDFWALKWFEDRTYDVLPPDAHNGGWDLDTAYTKDEENSATAGIKSYRGVGDPKTFKIYIEDVWWEWLEAPELVAKLRELQGPFHVEKKASGKSVVQFLKTYDIMAEEVPVLGDKLARASAAQPAVSVARVYVNKLVYQKLLYGEHQGLLRITAEALMAEDEGLDVNDAFVQAIHRHLGIGAPAKKKAKFR